MGGGEGLKFGARGRRGVLPDGVQTENRVLQGFMALASACQRFGSKRLAVVLPGKQRSRVRACVCVVVRSRCAH